MIKRANAGFTIVEMMITVGIIGCLAAIVFPNFIKARSSSHRSVCIANLKKIQDAKVTWGFENNKKPDSLPKDADLYGTENYLREVPKCPSQGVYAINEIKTSPSCTRAAAEGHTL